VGATAGGILITIRLTPRSGRDAIEDVEIGADGHPLLRVRVRAAAREGKANEALVRLIAKVVSVPAGAVRLVSGHASRVKRLKIDGDAVALAAALEAICDETAD
jgi:uncharacterized protein